MNLTKFLCCFMVLALSCHGSSQVDDALARWESSVKKKAEMESILQRMDGETAASLCLKGQMQTISGDLSSALNTLRKAALADPGVADPHYLLASLYYTLAMFDMADRGLCRLDLKPVGEIFPDSLRRNYLNTEMITLLTFDCPQFKALLRDAGITEKQGIQMQIYVLSMSKKSMAMGMGEMADELVRDLGKPEHLIIPSFSPDERAMELLSLAVEEAEKGSILPTLRVEKLMVGDPILSQRIRERILEIAPGIAEPESRDAVVISGIEIPKGVMDDIAFFEKVSGARTESGLDEIFDEDGSAPDSMWNLVLNGQMCSVSGKKTQAMDFYMKAAKMDPLAPEPLLGMADIIYESTIGPLAARNVKNHPDIEPMMISSMLDDEAAVAMDIVWKLANRARSMSHSRIEVNGGNVTLFSPNKAEELLSRTCPKLSSYWRKKGERAFGESRYKDAEGCYRKSIAYVPGDLSTVWNMTVSRLSANGHEWPFDDSALDMLMRDMKDSDQYTRAGAIIGILFIYKNTGSQKAEEYVEEMREEFPELFTDMEGFEIPNAPD